MLFYKVFSFTITCETILLHSCDCCETIQKIHTYLKVKISFPSTDYSKEQLLSFYSPLISVCFCIEYLYCLEIFLMWVSVADLGLFYMNNLGFLPLMFVSQIKKNIYQVGREDLSIVLLKILLPLRIHLCEF